ncbi:UbiE family methyltransferase [Athelia psychrophila]|uniref:UbiE family methyltransferase n=1 Tax=Athelia psychrophila TaxID=1759441 RepID=A0A166WUX1_9AGAM|nr:UbiE family methyltransferase [Fibularhizoctonia sp. CBS 109695]
MSQEKETAVYTHGHHESVLRSHTWRTAANSAAYLIPHLQPHMSILDVGCGPGTITADLAALVPQGRVTGLEHAPAVLAQARSCAAARQLTNVDFVVGDVHALAFPDGAFDVVHAHQVLQHVGSPVQALREMRRVTKPGGIVAVRDADYAAMAWHPAVAGMEAWQRMYLAVARGNGGEPNAGRMLHAWAHEAGFEWAGVAAGAGTWCYQTPGDRAWWSGLWADRILASAFKDGALAGGHATQEELEKASLAWRDWGAKEDGWFVVLHGELICRV